MELELIAAGILLLILGFLAAIDVAFSHISDVGLRRISADDDSVETSNSVKFLREILDNRPRFRFALSSAIQILLIAVAVLITSAVNRFEADRIRLLAYSFLISLGVTALFRQILPRFAVRANPERKLLFLLPAIRPLYSLTSFFVESVSKDKQAKAREKIEMTLSPNLGDDRDEDGNGNEDFQALMEVGEAEGIIEEKEREMIETMVEFSETRAGEIMTPRTGIVAVPANTPIKDARDVMIEEKYSRLPIYDESIDNIIGMVYVRDLLAALATGRKEEPVENIKREAFFVPETKTASELLKSMQQNHVQIAVVIDEYGGVAGLVTVEDIVEEIVGEIEDEDTEQEEIIEIIEGDDGYWDVLGATEIFKIERLVDLELEDEDYTTIAGLVVTEAGYVPKVGEKLELRGLNIEILQADEKRINLIRLRKKEQTSDESQGDSDHE
jgi:putative hemolysin